MGESYPNRLKHCGKGEMACYEQFLLFPQCFRKACFPGASKGVIVWEWVNLKHWIFCAPAGWLSGERALLMTWWL